MEFNEIQYICRYNLRNSLDLDRSFQKLIYLIKSYAISKLTLPGIPGYPWFETMRMQWCYWNIGGWKTVPQITELMYGQDVELNYIHSKTWHTLIA